MGAGMGMVSFPILILHRMTLTSLNLHSQSLVLLLAWPPPLGSSSNTPVVEVEAPCGQKRGRVMSQGGCICHTWVGKTACWGMVAAPMAWAWGWVPRAWPLRHPPPRTPATLMAAPNKYP